MNSPTAYAYPIARHCECRLELQRIWLGSEMHCRPWISCRLSWQLDVCIGLIGHSATWGDYSPRRATHQRRIASGHEVTLAWSTNAGKSL